MEASLDGIRICVARSYKNLASAIENGEPIQEHMEELKAYIGVLLCLYDDNIEGDCNCLEDRIEEVLL
jgi:hypothetical protein